MKPDSHLYYSKMAYQYGSVERPVSSFLSPALSTSSAYTIPSSSQKPARVTSLFPGTLGILSTDNYTNATTRLLHSHSQSFGSMDEDSGAESRFTGGLGVGFDGRCAPAGWEQYLRRELAFGNDWTNHSSTNFTEQDLVVGGRSNDSPGPLPLLAGPESDPSSVWEGVDVDIDDHEIGEAEATRYEAFDGKGEALNETNDSNRPFDVARFGFKWPGPTPCYLGGCRPGRYFTTMQSWNSHVKNVHNKNLFCLEPGCPHIKPFANKTDLKRHNETKHGPTKPYRCERSLCTRKVKAWPRKDKLKAHNSKYHSHYRCFFCSQSPRHETWFDTESELWSHTLSYHPEE